MKGMIIIKKTRYLASVSFGKDSLAMLLKLLEEKEPLSAVIFYNNGMEFDSIYHIRNKIIPILKKYNIEFVELTPSSPFIYRMYQKEVHKRDGKKRLGYGWCGGKCRWETSEKVRQINKYLKSLNCPYIQYIGIAKNEIKRLEKRKNDKNVLFPLEKWNMSESDCLNYCYQKRFFMERR